MAKQYEWTQLGRDKVLSSGITTTQANALGMYEVPSAALLHNSFEARPALVIPYFNMDHKPLPQRPGWDPFYRIRYLDKSPFDFKKAAGAKEPPKYMQPPETIIKPYFPKPTDWISVAKDVSQDIIITEGELKAAAGCEAGLNVIGLGGVWSFRSFREGILWLPELEQVKWARRRAYICYDSDYLEKDGICRAINSLAEELQERGAFVRLMTLPQAGEDKVGLDDYLLDHTSEDVEDLMRTGQPLGMTGALWKVNDNCTYVRNPGFVVVGQNMDKVSVEAFKGHSDYATTSVVSPRLAANGLTIYDKESAAATWIKWPHRQAVDKITYSPGDGKYTDEGYLNMWRGWGCVPKKGNVDPWIKLTKFIFADCTTEQLEYFYDWLAYPIQNPGAKMFVGVIIHGTAQGTGKTLIGYTMKRIYGENFKEIKDDDLEETYWAENKQFILGDEVSGKDNRKYMNTLKGLITKDNITVNIKFVPQFELPNRMNFLFTSQHSDSFFLEDKDRRFLVVEVKNDPLPLAFYKEYDKWYKGDGARYLFDWLLARKIDKEFNAMAHAPTTMAKERMIVATKGELSMWVHELRSFPEQILKIGQMIQTRDLYSSAELLRLYEATHPNSKVTSVGMAKALNAAGLEQVANGQPIRDPEGKMQRYYAVRNLTTWKNCKDRKKMEKNLTSQPIKG